jgi:hypothetical protein
MQSFSTLKQVVQIESLGLKGLMSLFQFQMMIGCKDVRGGLVEMGYAGGGCDQFQDTIPAYI